MNFWTTSDRQQRSVWLLLGIGLGLRMWQFAGGAALFLDEIALARNIVGRDARALLSPLDYGQVAPPAFLLAERGLWSVFHADWALRVLPFASAVLSLFLFRALANRVVRGTAIPLAMGAFALGVPFVMYGAQVKQYSIGVAITLALLLLVLPLTTPQPGSRVSLPLVGAAGVVAVWFSESAMIVMAGLGAALMILAAQRRLPDAHRIVRFIVLPWAVVACAAALLSRRLVAPDTMDFMQFFWADAFVPLPPRSMHDLLWPWHTLIAVFHKPDGLGYRFAPAYALLAAFGMGRSRRAEVVLLVAPIVVALGLATVRLYPFSGRLIVFLYPLFILFAAEAASEAFTGLVGVSRPAGVALLLLLSVPPIERIASMHPVLDLQPADRLLAWLSAHRQDGDRIWAWYRTVPNVDWYGPRFGITASDYTRGGCWISEPRRYLKELDRLRGTRRAWLIVSYVDSRSVRMIADYANAIGVRKERMTTRTRIEMMSTFELWLYDFSDSTRFSGVSADQFPVAMPTPSSGAALDCGTGPYSRPRKRV